MISAVDLASRPNLRQAIRRVGIKAYLGVSGPVMIDSGGFSIMSGRGRHMTAKDTISIYRDLGADIYAALDVPPGRRDGAALRHRKWQTTLTNLDHMMEHLGPDRLMPVVHGRTLDEIVEACHDVLKRNPRPRIVALGGMVPFLRGQMSERSFRYRRANGSMAAGEMFVADAIHACRSELPYTHLHVFGVGATTTALAVLALGANSVDSLAWRRSAGFGTIFLAGSAERIVSTKARARHSRPGMSIGDQELLGGCECPICSLQPKVLDRVRALARSYVARAVHNVWTLRMEEIAFREAVSAGVVGTFIVTRIRGRHRFAAIVREYVGGPYVGG